MINKIQVPAVHVKNTHYNGTTCVGTKMDYLHILRLKKVGKMYKGGIPMRIVHIILN